MCVGPPSADVLRSWGTSGGFIIHNTSTVLELVHVIALRPVRKILHRALSCEHFDRAPQRSDARSSELGLILQIKNLVTKAAAGAAFQSRYQQQQSSLGS